MTTALLLSIMYLIFPAPDSLIFRRGMTYLQSGSPDSMLLLWEKHLSSPSAFEEVKPEMAFMFIEWVAALKVDRMEFLATEIYFQGVKNAAFSNPALLSEEIARLHPLINEKDRHEWKIDRLNSPELVLGKVRRFWGEQDEIPSTLSNENLIRHWCRIHEARERFVRIQKPPYNTDDRGIIYVRYGEPFQRKKVSAVVTEYRDVFTYSPTRLHSGGLITVEVEIWRYRIPHSKHPLIYFFGVNKDENKPFGLVSDLTDLVPTRDANAMGNLGSGRIPQFQMRDLLRVAGLQSLAWQSPETASFYQDFESILLSYGRGAGMAVSVNAALQSYNSQLQTAFDRREREAPKTLSGKRFEDYPDYFEVRMLHFFDSIGTIRPVAHVITSIDAASKAEKNRLNIEAKDTIPFLVKYHLRSFDATGSLQSSSTASRTVKSQGVSMLVPGNQSYSNGDLFVAAEWFSLARDRFVNSSLNDISWPKRLLLASEGPVKVPYQKFELNPDLQVSDLIIGDLNRGGDKELFPVLPDSKRVLGDKDTLWVYFEVSKTPVPAFQVDVQVKKKRSPVPKTSITLNYQRTEPVAREYFELPLNQLKKGTWNIVLTVRSGAHRVIRQHSIELVI
jgi:GWxTD domain-containing protein